MRTSLKACVLASLVGVTACRPAPASVEPEVAAASVTAGIVVVDGDGAEIELDQLRSDVTVLYMWAAWCGACTARMPAIDGLAARFAGDDQVSVMVVSVDEPEDLEDAGAKAAEYAPHATDVFARGIDALGPLWPKRPNGRWVVSLPTIVIIAADGTMHYDYGDRRSLTEYEEGLAALVESARAGTLESKTEPPAESVQLRMRKNDAGRLTFDVLRASNDPEAVVRAMLELGGIGLDEATAAAWRISILEGLEAGQTVFVVPAVAPSESASDPPGDEPSPTTDQ